MELLDAKVAQDVIFEGMSLGADFVDIFVERCLNEEILFKSSKADQIQSGTKFGIGIRLIYGDQSLYGFTNINEREELLRITRLLGARIGKKNNPAAVNFEKGSYPVIATIQDRSVDVKHKIHTLSEFDKLLRTNAKVTQASLTYFHRKQQVEIFNSEGLHTSEMRPYTRFMSQIVMQDGQLQSQAYRGPGCLGGWEFVEKLDRKEICEDLIQQATTALYAKPCPAGVMPVVIDNAFGGVIFHEACGHLLETTSVEKKASVFWDKMGEKIAHEALSATDDGTIDGEWGSLSIDDEGMPTQKTSLIENGVLKRFISDRLGEIKTGHKRTGSARRESYRYAPASRMRNTFINPGPHSLEEIISTIDKGVFAKRMGGGSVNPGTGQFNFAVQEGYLIENGKIKDAVKGATLIGSGSDIMTKISMIGSNFAMEAGMCGSVSGSIPTTVGQPPIKVDEILVGGRA